MLPPGTEKIEETTVGGIGSWSVGVANIWVRNSYKDPRGKECSGLSANVSLWHDNGNKEFELYVGEGSVIDLKKDGRWRVAHIEHVKNDLSWIELKKV